MGQRPIQRLEGHPEFISGSMMPRQLIKIWIPAFAGELGGWVGHCKIEQSAPNANISFILRVGWGSAPFNVSKDILNLFRDP